MEIIWRAEVVPEGVAAAAWDDAVEATPRVRPGTPRGGQTQCKRDHALTDPENVYLHNGRRHCRACRALRERARRKHAA